MKTDEGTNRKRHQTPEKQQTKIESSPSTLRCCHDLFTDSLHQTTTLQDPLKHTPPVSDKTNVKRGDARRKTNKIAPI